jgi:hypothetical protein
MMRFFSNKIVCATMFVLFALSAGASTYSALAPAAHHTIADSPWGGPDPWDDDGPI